MDLRPYRPETDFDAVLRIWREVGWVEKADEHTQGLEAFMSVGSASVALLDGDAECMVHWTPGSIRHTGTDLPFCGVTAVTTSRIARKLGFATALTARALVEGIEAGCAVAGLGMFDQGFYDRLGFGTGPYEHRLALDPGSLQVDVPYRTPVRVTPDDWRDVHAALTGRMRPHGSLVLRPPEIVKAELLWIDSPFGLGYRDGSGELTHFVMGPAKGENGPYTIWHIAYRDPGQLLELLRLIRELADQVVSVVIMEPPEIQLQDVIRQPIRGRISTRQAKHEVSQRATAFWQLRILDLDATVAAHAWPGPAVAFNLSLEDPLAGILAGAGIGGDYTVTVGTPSSVERGHRTGLPLLQATVNAFSRLWFGVRPASGLAITDRLQAPRELLAELDVALRLPQPRLGWFI